MLIGTANCTWVLEDGVVTRMMDFEEAEVEYKRMKSSNNSH